MQVIHQNTSVRLVLPLCLSLSLSVGRLFLFPRFSVSVPDHFPLLGPPVLFLAFSAPMSVCISISVFLILSLNVTASVSISGCSYVCLYPSLSLQSPPRLTFSSSLVGLFVRVFSTLYLVHCIYIFACLSLCYLLNGQFFCVRRKVNFRILNFSLNLTDSHGHGSADMVLCFVLSVLA